MKITEIIFVFLSTIVPECVRRHDRRRRGARWAGQYRSSLRSTRTNGCGNEKDLKQQYQTRHSLHIIYNFSILLSTSFFLLLLDPLSFEFSRVSSQIVCCYLSAVCVCRWTCCWQDEGVRPTF